MDFEKIHNFKQKVETNINKTKIFVALAMFGFAFGAEAQNNENSNEIKNITNNISVIDSYTKEKGENHKYEGSLNSNKISEEYKEISINGTVIKVSEKWMIVTEQNGLSFVDKDKDGSIDRVIKINQTQKQDLDTIDVKSYKELFEAVDSDFLNDIIPESTLDLYYLERDCKGDNQKEEQVILNIEGKTVTVLDYNNGSVNSAKGEDAEKIIKTVQKNYQQTLEKTSQNLDIN